MDATNFTFERAIDVLRVMELSTRERTKLESYLVEQLLPLGVEVFPDDTTETIAEDMYLHPDGESYANRRGQRRHGPGDRRDA